MKITQFRARADGNSYFQDVDITLGHEREGAGGYTLLASDSFSSDTICFVSLPADLDQDWHQAPTRQLVVVISGVVEVTTTDDETRRWGPGEVFIAGDVSGRGHRTRVIDGVATVMFVPIPATMFS